MLEALKRELMEEGRIEVLAEPVLHGLFFNNHVSPRDHVLEPDTLGVKIAVYRPYDGW